MSHSIKIGFVLGAGIFLINLALTFLRLDVQTHEYVSYLSVPLIVGLGGASAVRAQKESGLVRSTISAALTTLYIGLLIGFGTLALLNAMFFEIVQTNPLILKLFAESDRTTMSEFLVVYTLQSAAQSTVVSTVITLLVSIGVFGVTRIYRGDRAVNLPELR